MIQCGQEKKLREGDITRREFLAEMQDEAALHFQDDVGKPFRVGAKLGGAVQGEDRGGVQRA
jgi:hypothetical protein